jgi:hypothetical protein
MGGVFSEGVRPSVALEVATLLAELLASDIQRNIVNSGW